MLKKLKLRILSGLTATALMALPLGTLDSCHPEFDDATPISIPNPF